MTEATGDCYEAAFKLLEQLTDETARLVHAMCVGQGKIEGVLHGHAWVETTKTLRFGTMVFYLVTVHDHSNGRSIEMPAELYYMIGHPTQVHHYTLTEARYWAAHRGHYGHWELDCEQ